MTVEEIKKLLEASANYAAPIGKVPAATHLARPETYRLLRKNARYILVIEGFWLSDKFLIRAGIRNPSVRGQGSGAKRQWLGPGGITKLG